THARDADVFPDERDGPGSLSLGPDCEREFGTDLAAHPADDLFRLQLGEGGPVEGQDDVTDANARAVGGRVDNRGDDDRLAVFDVDLDTYSSELAAGIAFEDLQIPRIEVD